MVKKTLKILFYPKNMILGRLNKVGEFSKKTLKIGFAIETI